MILTCYSRSLIQETLRFLHEIDHSNALESRARATEGKRRNRKGGGGERARKALCDGIQLDPKVESHRLYPIHFLLGHQILSLIYQYVFSLLHRFVLLYLI